MATGTKEWAQANINIQLGCENGCRYCYARADAVRFKRCTREQWSEPVIDQKKVAKHYRKYDGVVMFPSTHDITPKNLDECMTVLEELLAVGNQVLIVSKPSWQCITKICDEFSRFKRQIVFRFTIGSSWGNVLAFWEPKAPGFTERFACLQYAYAAGYETSASCEPYLDGNVVDLYEKLVPFVTDSIWIGKLRHFNRRVDLTGVTEEQMKRYVEPLKAAQTDDAVWDIYKFLNGNQIVRWKDSIREVVEWQ